MSVIRKKIEFDLSEISIDEAIKEIDNFKKKLIEKTNTLKVKIANLIREKANLGFKGAVSDDVIHPDNTLYANVDVQVQEDGDILVVIANGDDAVWVEFGAGVYHNGSVGSSPNPLGNDLGFKIGGYGKQGYKTTWAFRNDATKERYVTHGTPASMPMYKALMECMNDFKALVREVFDSND